MHLLLTSLHRFISFDNGYYKHPWVNKLLSFYVNSVDNSGGQGRLLFVKPEPDLDVIDCLRVQADFRIPSFFHVVHCLDHLIFRQQVGVKLWYICDENLIGLSAENPDSSRFLSRQAEYVLLHAPNSPLRVDNWQWHDLNPNRQKLVSFVVISINEHSSCLGSHSFPTPSHYGESWWVVFPVFFGLWVRHNVFEVGLVLVLETRDNNLKVWLLWLKVSKHIVDRGETGLDQKRNHFVLQAALLDPDHNSAREDCWFRCYSVLVQTDLSESQKLKNHREFLLSS